MIKKQYTTNKQGIIFYDNVKKIKIFIPNSLFKKSYNFWSIGKKIKGEKLL